MPLQPSGISISLGQIRNEFRPNTAATNVNLGLFTRSGLQLPTGIGTGLNSTYDNFVDPSGTIRSNRSNMSLSNYYNTTRGLWRGGIQNSPGNSLPFYARRVRVRVFGAGGGAAVRCGNNQRRIGAGGGGGYYDQTLFVGSTNCPFLGGQACCIDAWFIGAGGSGQTLSSGTAVGGTGGATGFLVFSNYSNGQYWAVETYGGRGGFAQNNNNTGGGAGGSGRWVLFSSGGQPLASNTIGIANGSAGARSPVGNNSLNKSAAGGFHAGGSGFIGSSCNSGTFAQSGGGGFVEWRL